MSALTAERIIRHMYDHDEFTRSMGMEIVLAGEGSCTLQMKVRRDMLNGFSVAHGGITFALADSALAFASNSRGRQCLSIDTQINHLQKCREGDVLTAVAHEVSRARKTGRYEVEVTNQNSEMVAHFLGTVFITDEVWEII